MPVAFVETLSFPDVPSIAQAILAGNGTCCQQ